MTTTEPKAKRPPDRITCGGCTETWTGISRAHCSAEGCHQTFSGLSLFDQHRRRDTCLPPFELTIAGEPLRLVDGIWRSPEMSDDDKAARFGGAR